MKRDKPLTDRAMRNVLVCLALLLLVSFIFPYDRFNIPILHSTIIRIVIAVGTIGMCIRLAFALR